MQINFKKTQQLQNVDYGSVVTFFNTDGTIHNAYLIIKDVDGTDYRALNLQTLIPTDWTGSAWRVFEDILDDNDKLTYEITPSEKVMVGKVD